METKKSIKKRMLRDIFGIGLDEISECSETLERLMEEEKKSILAWIDKQSSKLTKEQKEEMSDWYSDNYWKIAEDIPNILRSSLFIRYYSFLENTLLGICRHLRNEYGLKLEVDDLKDTGIFKAQTYLKKVAGIEFPNGSHSWNEIVFYHSVRNIIVHKEGRVPEGKCEQAIKSFIGKKKWLKIDDRNRISFPDDFSAEVTKNVRDLIGEVIDALP